MDSLEEELRLDAEENEREVDFIIAALPSELKDKFGRAELLYMMDAIVEYYFTSGVLDEKPNDNGDVDIDLEKVADYVCKRAANERRGIYDPADVFFVVQADLDFQEQNLP